MLDDNDDTKSTGDNNNSKGDHQIPEVPEVKESGEDENQFTNPTASPSVTDGEDISSDAPSGEPQDIDKALSNMGLENDANGVKPLSSDDID